MINPTARQHAAEFDSWLYQVNENCGRFHAELRDREFVGKIDPFRHQALDLSIVDIAHARLFRTREDVVADSADHFYVAFQLRGSSSLEQEGNRVVMQQGDITLINSSRPCDFTYDAYSQQLSLIVPRTVMDQHLRFTHIEPCRKVLANTPTALLASQLIMSTAQQSSISRQEGEAVLDALVSLLRPALGHGVAELDSHEKMFRRALDVIDCRIGDEALSPETVAREIGVSIRGLYRLFARKDLVVAQYIKNRRLDLCAEALRREKGEVKVSAFGYEWGFRDSSHFSTAFKSRFGVAPGEYRKRFVS
ncbi:transcriptional regulator FeaR [Pokkaliibacter plantistimulans]|uniref:Transcriptional regulator FeaR n=1 Tax=Proteobacteria bacterium 228 TaxID=2083153 RepID=A0A2S5KPC8_9PROT|nr:transcriptional regulator FeaR [Pokkaliibacter plantistimulans]PPC76146.1 transcriptional regulator FeaR [Pokkaliibacter plantistimulans]